MTTIIATPDAMYADSKCETGYVPFNTPKMSHVKCTRLGEDYLVGGVGVLDEIIFMMHLIGDSGLHNLWKLHMTEYWPPNILTESESCLLIVTRDKKIYTMDSHLIACLVNEEAYPMGTGSEYAMSAIDFGLSPSQAIEFACKYDMRSKPPVVKLEFPTKPIPDNVTDIKKAT